MRQRIRLLAGLTTLVVVASFADAPPRGSHPSGPAPIARAFGQTSLFFTENRGQIDGPSAYYVDGRDMRLAFAAQGVAITHYGALPAGAARPPRRPGVRVTGLREVVDPETGAPRFVGTPALVDPPRRPRATVQLDFVGANPAARPVGRARTPTLVSFFHGPRPEWKTGLATFHEIAYADLWPGITLTYRADGDRVKYAFMVQPGADPRAIRLAWRGAAAVRVGADGAIEVATAAGSFRDDAPTAYQDVDGRRAVVAVRYVAGGAPAAALGSPAASGGPPAVAVSFDVGAYDPTRPLVIDPALFAYAGFFGGPDGNRGLGIAVDGAGAAYLCGETETDQGGRDAYAVKVSPDGARYDYIAYIGGRDQDTCFDIGVDPAGSAYLTGVASSSPNAGFPAVVGPDLTHNGGGDDTLVAKLSPSGTDLVYAGYLGGSGFDFGEGIRVAPDGSVYLSGIAGSIQHTFPVVAGPDLTYNGGYDAYVCKLKPVPDKAIPKDNYAYCGYIGGSAEDVGVFRDFDGTVGITAGHIAFDAAGNAYASGMTRSSGSSFPDGDGFGNLPSPDRTHNGDWDAWVAKVKPDGTGLLYAGYLGGSGQDEGYGAGVDAAGGFSFTGSTMSPDDFPAVLGPDLTYNGGNSDAFVAKVAPDGTRYVYAGFIGGTCTGDCPFGFTDEMGVGLVADADGQAYPIGWTYGTGTSFPAVNGPDLTPNGAVVSRPDDDGASGDAWVARVKPVPDAPNVLDNYDFIGFIGGAGWDAAFWVALDGRGGVYVAGDTGSDAATFPNGRGLAPFVSPRPLRTGEEFDAFVAKVDYDPAGPTLTAEPTPTATPTPAAWARLPWVGRRSETSP